VKARAAVVLFHNDRIALIERNRDGRHYFTFPGGKVKTGESPMEAASREAWEELGLVLKIGVMVAEIWYLGTPQYYFLAECMGGNFGLGIGAEMNSSPDSEKGSYRPIWLKTNRLLDEHVLPISMSHYVWKSFHEGWPETPLIITDQPPDEMSI
jgi:8-oxo-dGTP pyrophosphatase MutT (NUDIX family)